MTPPLIRAATPADLPALVDLWNAATPDAPTTLEIQEFRERNRSKALAFGRLVAEQHGQVCGVATFAQPEWSGEAGKLWVVLTVAPDSRTQGTGTALYAALLAEATAHGPSKLTTLIREDREDSLRFAARRGFAEVAREQDAELELSALNLSQREHSFSVAQAAGYTLTTLAAHAARVGEDEAWNQMHRMDADASRDAPLAPGDSMELPAPERYRQSMSGDPGFDASLWFVAVKAGQIEAVSQLSRSQVPGRFDTGFTGVARAHRGHRLAWALKYLALEEAARRGATTVRTTNDALNAPMRGINTGLGFVPTPAHLTLSLTLEARR
ncbi:GNAT family N-acetyltransferase [Deinococcus altitudinis]|uniref:GNAT family N-acetyltransferase n=1 Tax=Deinococcus altitudinis TaxID=468914 RepID=UPI0038921291